MFSGSALTPLSVSSYSFCTSLNCSAASILRLRICASKSSNGSLVPLRTFIAFRLLALLASSRPSSTAFSIDLSILLFIFLIASSRRSAASLPRVISIAQRVTRCRNAPAILKIKLRDAISLPTTNRMPPTAAAIGAPIIPSSPEAALTSCLKPVSKIPTALATFSAAPPASPVCLATSSSRRTCALVSSPRSFKS